MLVKVLDENRVKILMEDQDIELYDLPFEKLNNEDPVSRAFLYELIQLTYEQTGVNFQDCHLMVGVVPGVSRAYYILLTRMSYEGDGGVEREYTERTEPEMYIYKLDQGEDVIKFFQYLQNCPPQKSELYRYNGVYYILLNFFPHAPNDCFFEQQLTRLEEYGSRCKFRFFNESILKEWGERLLGPDAYGVFTKK